MSLSLTLACLWGIAANLLAMLPSHDNHRRAAYALIALGIPILGLVTYQHGPVAGMLVMGAACSILRWPVVFLGRRLRGRLRAE